MINDLKHNKESIKKTILRLIETGRGGGGGRGAGGEGGHTFLFINLFAVSNLSEKQISVQATKIV